MDSLITRSFDFPQLPHPIGVAGIAGKPETPVFSCFGNYRETSILSLGNFSSVVGYFMP